LCAAKIRAALCRNFVGENGNVPAVPFVNVSTLAVEWGGNVCPLKDSSTFRLMQTLCRRPGHVFAFDQLLCHVWAGHIKSPDTVRSTVRHLKRKLENADMGDLAQAIKACGRGYCISLPLRT
jgi:DNA-binding response OmpR family regulator